MRQTYDWINYVSMTVYGLIYLVALAVAWVGWRRKRHIGYFVITVWALVVLINLFMFRVIMNAMSPLVNELFPGTDPTAITMLGYMFAHAVPFILLLAGLALLVFRENPPPGSRDPSA